MSRRARVLAVIGTRPDAIKMLPVYRQLAADGRIEARLLSTGQHDGLLCQVLEEAGVTPDYDLRLMRPEGGLAPMLARVLRGVDRVLAMERPELVLVQGDTTTALGSALAAFQRRIPVGHVEAGLRTHCAHEPFPEEMNRRQIGVLADLHFAPTERALANLLGEGVPADRVFLTGNTVVDALVEARRLARGVAVAGLAALLPAEGRLLLVTVHRRENWGAGVEEVCGAIREVAREHDDVHVLFPVHPNPLVREPVHALLGGAPRVRLVDPLPYLTFLACLERAALVLTDSGGVQEEAPSFGAPLLVLRRTTERPEGVEQGAARVVGLAQRDIVAAVRAALAAPRADGRTAAGQDHSSRTAAGHQVTDREASGHSRYPSDREVAPLANPYGDGAAAVRIAGHVRRFLGLDQPETLKEIA